MTLRLVYWHRTMYLFVMMHRLAVYSGVYCFVRKVRWLSVEFSSFEISEQN